MVDAGLHEGELGNEGNLKVELKEGNLVVSVSYDGHQADASVSIVVDSGALLDKLKEAIPGDIDDAVIDIIKAALKA